MLNDKCLMINGKLLIRNSRQKLWNCEIAELLLKGIAPLTIVGTRCKHLLLSNCPLPNCPIAYCQIAHCHIAPERNCTAYNSWDGTNCRHLLLSNCPLPNCPLPNCPLPIAILPIAILLLKGIAPLTIVWTSCTH